MKFCLYEILSAMEDYRNEDHNIDSEELATFLTERFNAPVSDEGLFEATFVRFCNDFCG